MKLSCWHALRQYAHFHSKRRRQWRKPLYKPIKWQCSNIKFSVASENVFLSVIIGYALRNPGFVWSLNLKSEISWTPKMVNAQNIDNKCTKNDGTMFYFLSWFLFWTRFYHSYQDSIFSAPWRIQIFCWICETGQ